VAEDRTVAVNAETNAVNALAAAQRGLNGEIVQEIELKRLLSQIDEPRLRGPSPSTIGGPSYFATIGGGRFGAPTFQAGGRTLAILPGGQMIFVDAPN
jgi:hypothetical protein